MNWTYRSSFTSFDVRPLDPSSANNYSEYKNVSELLLLSARNVAVAGNLATLYPQAFLVEAYIEIANVSMTHAVPGYVTNNDAF